MNQLQHIITVYPERSVGHVLHSYEAPRSYQLYTDASKFYTAPYFSYNRKTGTLTHDLCPTLTRAEAYSKIQKYLVKSEDLDLIPHDTTYADLPKRETAPKVITTLSSAALTSYSDLIDAHIYLDINPLNCVFLTFKEPEELTKSKVNPLKSWKRAPADLTDNPKRSNGRFSEMCVVVDGYRGDNIISVAFLERGVHHKEVHMHVLVMWKGSDPGKFMGPIPMNQMIQFFEDEWCRICGLRSKEFRKKGFHAKPIKDHDHLENCIRYPWKEGKENYRLEGVGFGKRIRPRNWSRLTKANKETDHLTAAQYMFALNYLIAHTGTKGLRHLGKGRMSLKDRGILDKAINYGIQRGSLCYGDEAIHVIAGSPIFTFWDRGTNIKSLPKSRSVTMPDGSVQYFMEGFSSFEIYVRKTEVYPEAKPEPKQEMKQEPTVTIHGCPDEETPRQRARRKKCEALIKAKVAALSLTI